MSNPLIAMRALPWLMASALIFCISLPAPPARAQLSEQVLSCAGSVAQAERRLDEDRLDQAVRLARPCLQHDAVPESVRERALYVVSMAHLERAQYAEALAAAKPYLRAHPSYRPDPARHPARYTSFIQIARNEVRAEEEARAASVDRPPWYQRRGTWLAVGGGLFVGGIIAIVAGGE